jgi:hypothetical protein
MEELPQQLKQFVVVTDGGIHRVFSRPGRVIKMAAHNRSHELLKNIIIY